MILRSSVFSVFSVVHSFAAGFGAGRKAVESHLTEKAAARVGGRVSGGARRWLPFVGGEDGFLLAMGASIG